MAHKRILEIVQYRHDRCEKNKSHCTLGKIICRFNLFIFTGSENVLLYAYIYYASKPSFINIVLALRKTFVNTETIYSSNEWS